MIRRYPRIGTAIPQRVTAPVHCDSFAGTESCDDEFIQPGQIDENQRQTP